MTTECYDQAAQRHFKDAEMLAREGRYDSAGHLIGFSVECAIKHAIRLNLPADQSVPHKHLPELIETAKKALQGNRHRNIRTVLGLTNFMNGWIIDDRYSCDGAVTQEQYQAWKDHTLRALGAADLRVGARV